MSEFRIIEGDCLERLREMPDESVQCCVTSPPYWCLRDYGAEGQLGLEPTPEEYVANMVAVFREVRRVLRADGTLWLNLGDLKPNGQQHSPYAQGFAKRTPEQEAKRRERVVARRTVRDGVDTKGGGQGSGEMTYPPLSRNKRDVWTVNPTPFPGAHFATFPPKLIEPCILAGSAPGDTVLDPFNGAGTTGLVALRHDRDYIGIELNPEYAEMSRRRIAEDAPLLNTEAAA